MIAVESLTHAYDPRRVVLDAVSFQVRAGSVTGLVGPNGAGKTTLMRTIATLLRPRAGRVTVDGHDVVNAPERVRAVLGYLPERTTPYLELMCWEHLDFFARAAGLAGADRSARIARALERAGLRDRREEPVKELSKGLRQRLALQAALIHEPRALVLDEPTDGLDPESRGQVLASIRALAGAGCAVLISSHILSEIEQVSDQVVILVDGKRQDGAPVLASLALRVRLRDRVDEAERVLSALASVASVAREAGGLRVTLANGVADAGDVAPALVGAGLTLTALEPIEATLARTFQDVVARSRGEIMNPVLLKELRSLLRERRGFLVPMVYAAVLSATVYLFFVAFAAEKGDALGSMIAGEVAIVQLVAVAIFAPLVGAGAIAGERERGTWFALLASPVARWRIATGKALASTLYVLLLLSVSLPVASLSLLFGGADLAVLAGLYLNHALLGTVLALLGLAVSTLFQRTWTAALVSVGIALGLIVFTTALTAALGGIYEADGAGRIWPMYFNICYSWSLFFAGDVDPHSRIRWLWHFLALASIGAASFAFVLRRVRRTSE